MNPLLKNKFTKVALITFVITALYLTFVFFRPLWPYQSWFQPVFITYTFFLSLFLTLVAASNVYSLVL